MFNLLNLRISPTNSELKLFIQVHNRQRFSYSGDSVDSAGFLPQSIQNLLAEDTGFQGDEEEEEEDYSDDDSDSFNSTRTDLTFVPVREGDVSDEFCTAFNSRNQTPNTTPTNQNQVQVPGSQFIC
jgi:hypothetical protein